MATSADRMTLPHRHLSIPRALQIGVFAGLLAALGNLVVYATAEALLNLELVVPTGPGGSLVPLTPLNVILTSFIPGLMAGLLLYLLARVSSEPMQIFLGIALSVLLFSFTMPLGLSAIPTAVRLVLVAMHVVAAGAIAGIVTYYWKKAY